MTMTNPNRDPTQASDRLETQQKQSGDKHILPPAEPETDSHRPQQINREDMQKLRPADADPDDPASP